MGFSSLFINTLLANLLWKFRHPKCLLHAKRWKRECVRNKRIWSGRRGSWSKVYLVSICLHWESVIISIPWAYLNLRVVLLDYQRLLGEQGWPSSIYGGLSVRQCKFQKHGSFGPIGLWSKKGPILRWPILNS